MILRAFAQESEQVTSGSKVVFRWMARITWNSSVIGIWFPVGGWI